MVGKCTYITNIVRSKGRRTDYIAIYPSSCLAREIGYVFICECIHGILQLAILWLTASFGILCMVVAYVLLMYLCYLCGIFWFID